VYKETLPHLTHYNRGPTMPSKAIASVGMSCGPLAVKAI
jgi:hypothetical protein